MSLPNIPDIPLGTENQDALTAIKENIEVREGGRYTRGDRMFDKSVTYQDLVDLGLITNAKVPRK